MVRAFLMVTIASLVGLLAAVPIATAAPTNVFTYHLGDAFLGSLSPAFSPDNTTASANGDYLLLMGTGTFGGTRATGGGTFEHHHADGSLFASGTWVANSAVMYEFFGNGIPQGLPTNFFGGVLVLSITILPSGGGSISAVLTAVCLVGHPPAGAVEGVTVSVPGLITFDTPSPTGGGATVFILKA